MRFFTVARVQLWEAGGDTTLAQQKYALLVASFVAADCAWTPLQARGREVTALPPHR